MQTLNMTLFRSKWVVISMQNDIAFLEISVHKLASSNGWEEESGSMKIGQFPNVNRDPCICSTNVYRLR